MLSLKGTLPAASAQHLPMGTGLCSQGIPALLHSVKYNMIPSTATDIQNNSLGDVKPKRGPTPSHFLKRCLEATRRIQSKEGGG